MSEDGERRDSARARADIQMRLIVDVDSYEKAGRIMDAVDAAMRTVLEPYPQARFDFVSFQTHPCKALLMDEALYDRAQIERRSLDQAGPPY